MTNFATFLGLARQLVDGAERERFTPQVPESFREAWGEIVRRISESQE